MKHFTHSSHSSQSTNFDNNLTPIQAAAAIALGFGLQIPAVSAELKIHRSTLYNWARNPLFFKAVETANAEFQKQFRTQIAMLTRLALTNIQQILSDTEASPSVRLKAALAVLKQDWKLPESTQFDTIPEESDSLRNEMPRNPRSLNSRSGAKRSAATNPALVVPTLNTNAAAAIQLAPSTNLDSPFLTKSTTCETKWLRSPWRRASSYTSRTYRSPARGRRRAAAVRLPNGNQGERKSQPRRVASVHLKASFSVFE